MSVRVLVRVRPPLPHEEDGERAYVGVTECDESGRAISIRQSDARTEHSFTFDRVFGPDTPQQDVYDATAKAAVASVLEGYNATVLAYGQTGTGKTFTMEGFQDQDQSEGVIPRAVRDVFRHIAQAPKSSKFLVRVSFFQVYNEQVSDLLKPSRKGLLIRGTPVGDQTTATTPAPSSSPPNSGGGRGVYVENLSEWVVRSPVQAYQLLERGAHVRATAATVLNDVSSRSHAIFTLTVERRDDGIGEQKGESAFRFGKLNLVDLAGSERASVTGATGQHLEETKKINQSLSALGNVIAALTSRPGARKKGTHIPYRNSKLTRILQDSLGGNCKTTMIATLSPSLSCYAESFSTLQFAMRAKKIKNLPRVNQDKNEQLLIREYEREMKRLRRQLELSGKHVVDKKELLRLQQTNQLIMADQLATRQLMEELSRDLQVEKHQKKRLEARLRTVAGNILDSGTTSSASSGSGPAEMRSDTAAAAEVLEFKESILREQKQFHDDYQHKLTQLESEKAVVASGMRKQQQYQDLLLQQKAIIEQLTSRLQDRDEALLLMQQTDVLQCERIAELEDLVAKHAAQEVRELMSSLETQESQSKDIQRRLDRFHDPLEEAEEKEAEKEVIESPFDDGKSIPSTATSMDSTPSATEIALHAQIVLYQQERAALSVILDDKLKVLVARIKHKQNTQRDVTKELGLLEKLVVASANALKTSAASD